MSHNRIASLAALVVVGSLFACTGDSVVPDAPPDAEAQLQAYQDRYTALLRSEATLSEQEFGAAHQALAEEISEWNGREGLLPVVTRTSEDCFDTSLSAASAPIGISPKPDGPTCECPPQPPPSLHPGPFYICKLVAEYCDDTGRSCVYQCTKIFSWLPSLGS